VTSADAEYAAVTPVVLAERWQEILERELRDALQKRRPDEIQSSLLRLAGIILAAVLSNWLLAKLLRVLGRRKRWLWEQYQQAQSEAASDAAASQSATARSSTPGTADDTAAQGAHPTTSEEEWRRVLAGLLQLRGHYRLRYRLVSFAGSLISWIVIFVWVGAIAAVFYLIPQTRGLADRIVSIPVLILVAGFAASIVNGLLGLLIDLVADIWSRKDDPRRALRIPTVVAAAKGLTAVILYVAAFVVVLEFVLIVPFTVVAIGAILGLAVTFAAQSLVKDLVNGILILIEDQYALGDHVIIGGEEGVVERLNLRITQLRSPDGRLITIPNHAIIRVDNKTRLWSRVDLRVTVDYATDVDRALAVVEKVVENIEQDSQWRPFILAPHQMFGVEEITHAGIVLHFQLQTLPFKKENVARELRRRLKNAFDREEIRIGIPQQAVIVEGSRDSSGGYLSWRDGAESPLRPDRRQS
jgi:small conductance mechanosensitive channel